MSSPLYHEIQVEPIPGVRSLQESLSLYCLRVPRRAWQELFARGAVRVEGRPVSPRAEVKAPIKLAIHAEFDALASISVEGNAGGIEVLREDDWTISLSKPPGTSVVPDRGTDRQSCLGFLICREEALRSESAERPMERPRIVHRIDRWTSGLVIVARTLDAEQRLSRAFEERQVRKRYLALLEGDVSAALSVVNCPVSPGRKGRMLVSEGGKNALTRFLVRERFEGWTLVEAQPRTGRTHQIRVHAAAMGHSVAGDPLYSSQDAMPPGLERMALHAWRYQLPESWPGERLLECPLASDLGAAIDRLRG